MLVAPTLSRSADARLVGAVGDFGKVLTHAVIGGTASELTGGKFANGAANGAFSAIVNGTVRNLVPKVAGKVYVAFRRVAGGGPAHLAILRAGGNKSGVISAGSEDGLLHNGEYDGGDDGSDYGIDDPDDLSTIGEITPPDGVTHDEYYQMLSNANSNYGGNLDYDLFPGIQDGFNSNSFVIGMVKATGGSFGAGFDPKNYVGGSKPVPACNFSAGGCR